VGGDALGLRPGLGQEVRGARVAAVPLERREPLVDRAPDQGVDEAQGRLRAQDVGARQVAGRRRRALLVQIGEGGRLVRIDVVAQDGDCPGELRRLGREAGEPQRDGPPAGARRQLT
jgi:hypothetical protein